MYFSRRGARPHGDQIADPDYPMDLVHIVFRRLALECPIHNAGQLHPAGGDRNLDILLRNGAVPRQNMRCALGDCFVVVGPVIGQANFDFIGNSRHPAYPAGGLLRGALLQVVLNVAGERHHAAMYGYADMSRFHLRGPVQFIENRTLQYSVCHCQPPDIRGAASLRTRRWMDTRSLHHVAPTID
jgi:hypothetical protein